MTGNDAIEAAISMLANTMRQYVESHLRFAGLFNVDREEAIDNMDRAFDAKLEAFHRLYDVSKTRFPYFDHGDTALLIAVRNAIHHRDHPLFESLNAHLFLSDDPSHLAGASFLLASYPTRHGARISMHHHVKLDDLSARLDPQRGSLYVDTIMKPGRAARRWTLIEGDLALAAIEEQGRIERYPEDQIYLDLMPVFISAVARVFTAINADGVAFRRLDARTYLAPFTSEIDVDLAHPTFTVWRIAQ